MRSSVSSFPKLTGGDVVATRGSLPLPRAFSDSGLGVKVERPVGRTRRCSSHASPRGSVGMLNRNVFGSFKWPSEVVSIKDKVSELNRTAPIR